MITKMPAIARIRMRTCYTKPPLLATVTGGGASADHLPDITQILGRARLSAVVGPGVHGDGARNLRSTYGLHQSS